LGDVETNGSRIFTAAPEGAKQFTLTATNLEGGRTQDHNQPYHQATTLCHRDVLLRHNGNDDKDWNSNVLCGLMAPMGSKSLLVTTRRTSFPMTSPSLFLGRDSSGDT
jgi:hypothetical protein